MLNHVSNTNASTGDYIAQIGPAKNALVVSLHVSKYKPTCTKTSRYLFRDNY